MRLLVCGSRTWESRDEIRRQLLDLKPDEVIHGGARGADRLAGEVARELGIPVRAFPADWKRLGRKAGPVRNQQMLDEGQPDRVLAFRMEGDSPGTDDMIRRARKAGLPLRIVKPKR